MRRASLVDISIFLRERKRETRTPRVVDKQNIYGRVQETGGYLTIMPVIAAVVSWRLEAKGFERTLSRTSFLFLAHAIHTVGLHKNFY